MYAIVHSQMDQISGWARLQDDVNVSFEKAAGVIRQLREGNERHRAERDLLREKIVRSADEQEETSALLKRSGVIVKKLMDEMTCSASSAKGWWRNPWMRPSSVLRTRKSSSPLTAETIPRPAATHQESRDQRARSLSSFFF